jgi:3-methylfumaryl-CoA hydratase
MAVDIDELRRVIGRCRIAEDVITPGPAARLSATLDRDEPPPKPGEPLPPLWHWLYFLDAVPQAVLGPDGHTVREDGFLPPMPLPRRMWAGSRFAFRRSLPIGEPATRQSVIRDVSYKQGRSGALVFITVRHVVSGAAGPAIEEEHDIVFREAPRPGATSRPPAPAPDGPWRREIRPDPVMLFRYSALTFNGHRIHYDHPYATRAEGYPGLVVHGPLLATLMLDLLRRQAPGARVRRFEFRAHRPVFDTGPFAIGGAPQPDGTGCRLWATDNDGWLAAEGEAEVAG